MIAGEPGQTRKGAATVSDTCAGMWLVGLPPNFPVICHLKHNSSLLKHNLSLKNLKFGADQITNFKVPNTIAYLRLNKVLRCSLKSFVYEVLVYGAWTRKTKYCQPIIDLGPGQCFICWCAFVFATSASSQVAPILKYSRDPWLAFSDIHIGS